ncbi:hypothetical protein YSA_09168 [Pseudomonas putida ND6]|uniref:Uncharacterized protein n=1 Tax=Pseudomonas putida ND6 TaxID=231023 RepID=I3V1W1_PSEPU|nr:hypothetical protein YSA_09168 [Pseudomonas putida ND6]
MKNGVNWAFVHSVVARCASEPPRKGDTPVVLSKGAQLIRAAEGYEKHEALHAEPSTAAVA